jgi:Holliday junction resolvasome RuvABC endonuclease subunit
MPEKQFGPGVDPLSAVAIGIDQSLTGFALSIVDLSDHRKHDTRVFKSAHRGAERLNDISRWLNRRLNTHLQVHIADIAMEGTVRASMAASVLGELAGVTKLQLWDRYRGSHFRRPLLVPPMTLKKFVTGVGNAKKNEMLLKTYQAWGIEFNDDNAADAYGLAMMAGGLAKTKVQKDILLKLQDEKYRD